MSSTGRTSTRGRTAARWGALAAAVAFAAAGAAGPAAASARGGKQDATTATPVKHLVVIFDENISFDHYFGTYPEAANTDGTKFTAAKGTPKADNLVSAHLLKTSPNLYTPQRLSPSQALTCSQNHNYTPEQYAYDGGKADQFVQYTEKSKCSGGLFGEPGLSMDYYDGNTVTALWNYAQHYALGDNSFSSTYGPSTPGALNLIAGQTHGVYSADPASGTTNPAQTGTPAPLVASPDAHGVGTLSGDADPAFDDCSNTDHTASDPVAVMKGRNIGDLLNSRGVSWGWFQGGFAPTTAWDGKAGDYAQCDATHPNAGGAAQTDYSPHHNPFAFYRSTSNPHHLPPASVAEIGHNGRANHEYDLTDFDAAVRANKLPAVSFLKAGKYQDAHAGNSDPIDEQNFLVKEINQLQKSRQWQDTAVVVAYDDSDGWYDHVYSTPRNGSRDSATTSGLTVDSPACQAGPAAAGGYADRCGPGTRQPLLVISPFSKSNAIDHKATEQASITKFIEDNWRTGRIGDSSFDQRAGSLNGMFDFRHPNNTQVLLNADGSVASVKPVRKVADPDRGNLLIDPAAALSTPAGGLPSLPAGLAGAAVILAAGAAITVGVRRNRATR